MTGLSRLLLAALASFYISCALAADSAPVSAPTAVEQASEKIAPYVARFGRSRPVIAVLGENAGTVLPDYVIKGANPWKYEVAEPNDMYMQEHRDLIASIRAGKPYNELKSVAESSLTAIMGRMSAYSGKAITWDEAMASTESLVPASLHLGPIATPPVPMPGHATN